MFVFFSFQLSFYTVRPDNVSILQNLLSAAAPSGNVLFSQRVPFSEFLFCQFPFLCEPGQLMDAFPFSFSTVQLVFVGICAAIKPIRFESGIL